MAINRTAFKAYDIRGRVPEELNEELAYRVGRSYAQLLNAKTVVVGRDIRLSSESLGTALTQGLTDAGCKVIDIGLCDTELVYFATFRLKTDGGIMVTASHNPKDYNGMKLVREDARPVSGDSGLRELEEMVVKGDYASWATASKGSYVKYDIMQEYISHILSHIQASALKPLKVVVNPAAWG